jgi:3-oxoadipate enol-lactonase / 4-carboxymuconolactone decarboxylase
MPFVHANGIRHYYRLDGRDHRPVLMLSHSLGCDHTMWDAQTADLAPYFRVLRYDTRGHGATDATAGDYSIELLAGDALGIARAVGIREFAWCGLSLGGMIGQWIAAHEPGRVTRLVLANTSARYADPSVMERRRRTVIEQGIAAVVDSILGRFFTPESLAAETPAVAAIRRIVLATGPQGYAGCCAAVRDLDQVRDLRNIQAPALIIVGKRDVSTPWEGAGETLAREISDNRVVRLNTAHLSNLEKPRSFSAALLDFLAPATPGAMERRRAVLGDAHVDRAIAATTDLTRAFQEFITTYAWGAIWARPGLDDHTRRLLVLTATAALGRWEEFRLHVRTGLERELEPCDLEEALLQCAVYAGLPAANTGFQIASEELNRTAEHHAT